MKININKPESIQTELDRVQKLARVRTINLTELLASVEKIESKLTHSPTSQKGLERREGDDRSKRTSFPRRV